MPHFPTLSSKLEVARLLDKRSFKRLIRRTALALVFFLGVPLLILIALVAYLITSSHWVDHSDRVVAKASQMRSRLLTMQSNFRGYRLTGEPAYWNIVAAERQQLESNHQELAKLVLDNPSQTERVSELQAAQSRWLAFLDREKGGISKTSNSSIDPSFLDTGVPLFEAIENRNTEIIQEEGRLRAERDRYFRIAINILGVFIGLALLIGVPAFTFWMLRMLRRSSQAYAQSLAIAEYRAHELQVTLNSIGDAVITTNADGLVNFINPAAEAATEWTNETALGQPLAKVFNIYHEATGVAVEDPVKHVLQKRNVVELVDHTMLRSLTGREIPIEDSAAPICDEQDNIIGVVLVFRDVQEKRAAERERARIQQRAEFLMGLSEVTRKLHDTRSIMAATNRMLGEALQASRCAYAEMAQDEDAFTIFEDYVNGCATTAGEYRLSLFGPVAVESMQRGQTLVIREMNSEVGQGAEMFQSIGIQAIVCCPLIKSNRLRAMMAVHQTQPRDWTHDEIQLIEEVVERCWATIERQRAEAESRQQAERLRLFSETVAIQVWTANRFGELDYVNAECLHYFKLPRAEDLFGKVWFTYVHPEDAPQVGELWQKSLASGQDYEVEFRVRRHDGKYRWFLVRAKALRDKYGRPATWFGTNSDIHDLKTAQREAEIASQKKDDFLAALSHELRTPLTPVLLCTSSLLADPDLSEDVRDQLQMMERNITLEARLIDDLLDVTSISQGKLQLHTAPCDAHRLIGEAREIVEVAAITKHITLQTDFRASRYEIIADPARFQQVIWNLLRNAVKFTPEHGHISIATTDLNENLLQIAVTDSGIGIPPTVLQQIFAPFEQGDLTGNHRFGGLGLGLAIVQALGGNIRAASEGTGRGATFTITLPGYLPDGPNKTPVGPSLISPNVEAKNESATFTQPRLRLLLVEDHESTLVVMSRLLTRDGHTVVAANSAQSALERAAEATFDLVISDLGLPDSSGFELMEKLRDLHQLRGIALSGYGMEEDLVLSRKAGFIMHLVKPVDFTKLREALATIHPSPAA